MNLVAEVVDIDQYTPRPTDVFFVDTNVWAWVTYSKASLPPSPPAPAQKYPAFVQRARSSGAKLLHCGLSLSELSNIIERTEFREFAATKGQQGTHQERKAFRHDAAERQRITAEIAAAWGQVEALSSCADLAIGSQQVTACLNRLTACAIDPYDGFFVECLLGAGVVNVLTDDTDLCTVQGVRVFTGHPVVIRKARAAGRLRTQ